MVITRSVLKTGFLRTVFKGMSGNLSGPAPDHVEGGYNDAAFKKNGRPCCTAYRRRRGNRTDVVICVADGSNEDQVKAAIEKGVEHFGKLNVLINSAQTSASGLTLVEHTQADFDKAIYSGLYATFFYMKHAFPYLKESHGSVINFASGAGISGKPGQSSYAAAKEGIRGLSRVAANEWGPYDINVNVVLPLVMTDKLAQWGQENPEMFKKNLDEIPLGRYGDAQKDIGKVCVFLASYDAKYITGDTLFIQGGVGMKP